MKTEKKPVAGAFLSTGILCLFVLAVAARGSLSDHDDSSTDPPPPPSWPGRFSTQMLSNRTNHFGFDKLWYDWDFQPGVGRQVIRIVKEDGSMIYDVMPGDGNAYYIDPHAKSCKAIKFGVSILTPDWQQGGEYLGRREVDGQPCYSWKKGFGIQCTSEETQRPLLITFDRKESPTWTEKFLTYELDDAAPEELYHIPSFCPKPSPLPPAQMAEVRDMLRSFTSHTPHILLDDEEEQGSGAEQQTDTVLLTHEDHAYFGGCPHMRAVYEAAMGREAGVQ